MGVMPHTSETLGDPMLPTKDYVNVLLREAASDLRANNRDLRLILGFIEKDAARLRASFESEKAASTSLQGQIQALTREVRRLEERNELLEDLLDLPANETSTSGRLHLTRHETLLPPTPTTSMGSETAAFPSKSPSPTDFGDDVHRTKRIKCDAIIPTTRKSSRIRKPSKKVSWAGGSGSLSGSM